MGQIIVYILQDPFVFILCFTVVDPVASSFFS